MMITERVKLPLEIANKMTLWREGFISLPKDYIEFYKNLAEKALAQLNVTVHNKWMASDGWADGMQVLWAVVETRKGELFKIYWHDGSQRFFQQSPTGGSFPWEVE